MKKIGLLLFAALLPCSLVLAQDAVPDASVPAEGIAWYSFEEAVSLAETEGKKLLVDIYAPWCPWCRKLQREVYTDQEVRQYVTDHFVTTRLDGDDADTRYTFKSYDLSSNELAMGLGAQGFPTTVFLAANGDYITKVPGFVDAGEFLTILKYIGTEAYLKQSFPEFAERQK